MVKTLLSKAKSGIWFPSKHDKFTLKTLLAIEKFFVLDLERAEENLARYKKIVSAFKLQPKYNSRRKPTTLAIYERDVIVSQTNLDTVRRIIEVTSE